MSFGGGTFTSYDKRMPGAYINFVSGPQSSTTALERGVVAVALNLDWGAEDEIVRINADTIENSEQNEGLYTIGYPYTSDFVKPLREIFKSSEQVLLYRLNGGGTKASNSYATAKYSGTRGNDIQISITQTVDTPDKYTVETYIDGTKYDSQTVTSVSDLVDNNLVSFKASATLQKVSGVALTGGTNGEGTASKYQDFLTKLENKTFKF